MEKKLNSSICRFPAEKIPHRIDRHLLYEPIVAGWPPATQCRPVTGNHRLRHQGIVLNLSRDIDKQGGRE